MEIVRNEYPDNLILIPCVKPRIIINAEIIITIEVPITAQSHIGQPNSVRMMINLHTLQI